MTAKLFKTSNTGGQKAIEQHLPNYVGKIVNLEFCSTVRVKIVHDKYLRGYLHRPSLEELLKDIR